MNTDFEIRAVYTLKSVQTLIFHVVTLTFDTRVPWIEGEKGTVYINFPKFP